MSTKLSVPLNNLRPKLPENAHSRVKCVVL